MVIIKNTEENKCWHGYREKETYSVGRNVISTAFMKNKVEIFQKIKKKELFYDPAISTKPEENGSKKHLHPHIYCNGIQKNRVNWSIHQLIIQEVKYDTYIHTHINNETLLSLKGQIVSIQHHEQN